MYLDLHDGFRAWKGYPWDVLDFLFEAGFITDPKRKAKSVALTDDGVTEAARCFRDFLSVEPAPAGASRSQSGGSGLPDIQRQRVDALLGPLCQPHPDPAVSSQVRRGYRLERSGVVLFESRPSLFDSDVWQDHLIAKFKFNKSRATWHLYCMFRDLKWRAYKPFPEAGDLADLLREVQADPTGIFWG
jgi:hypothetical protein